MKNSKLNLIILLLFFLSGMAALIYQVVWARKLGLVFGTTTYAISTILTVFMAGLALGSFFFGKIVDRFKETRKSLLLFALLEIGVGIYAFFTPLIFKLINQFQLVFLGSINSDISTLNINLIRFGLSFLALILPSILMGGTLPVLSKFFIQLKEEVGRKFALLYSLNTFGGVAGVILAGFFLIISLGLGVDGTIYFAASIDTLVGLCFLGISIKYQKTDIEQKINQEENINLSQSLGFKYILLFVFFFTGFAALALEVLWTRALVMTVGSSTYAFSLILAGFLTGIALGSILVAKFVDKIKNLWFWLALIIGLIGASVISLTLLFDKLPFYFVNIFGILGDSFWKFETAIFSLIFLVLLLPTLLMGMTFPLGIKIYIRDIKRVGSSLGEIYSINTLGCIFGSLFAGFLFLPTFGLQKSILICALIYFLLALILGILSLRAKQRIIFLLIIIGFGISSFFLPQWNKYILTSGPAVYARQYLMRPEVIYGEPAKEEILFYKDGLSANVFVSKLPKGFLVMRVNGKADASAGKIEFKQIGDLDTMLLTGYLPLLLHPEEPQNALIVGLGSGITLGAMTQYPLEEIDLVEIEPAIVEGAGYFKEFNHDALNNPRVKLIIEDGRNYLAISSQKYDVISSQPSNPWVKGNANLFTQEYYELCRDHLQENGLMFQWVQLYSLDKKDLESIIYTFSEVFPSVQVWSAPSYKDLFLIGSLEPIGINQEKFKERFNIPEIKEDFRKAAIFEPEEILSQFIFSQDQVKNFSKPELHIDNYPFLEFKAPLSLYQDTVSENLEELYLFKEDIEKLFGVYLSQKMKDFQEKSLAAIIAKEKGNSEQAIKFYEEALSIKSNPLLEEALAEYYYGKGKLALLNNDINKANSYYKKAVQLNPKEPVFLNSLGSTYLEKDDFKNAEIWLKKAVESGPWYTWSFSNLGLLYLKQGRYDLAEKYLKQALEISVKNTDALNWLAIVYYNKGQYEKAEEVLEKSLKINSDQPKTKERIEELKKILNQES